MDFAKEAPSERQYRQARLEDAFGIFNLISDNMGEMIVRPIGDIVRNIDRFLVATENGVLVSCASFTIWPEPGDFNKSMVELTSVAVREDIRGKGIGAELVRRLLQRIRDMRPGLVIVLTCTPAFFAKLGFSEIPKTEIMHKIYAGCINCTKQVNPFVCPEVAMGLKL